jgi:hypothetical protein
VRGHTLYRLEFTARPALENGTEKQIGNIPVAEKQEGVPRDLVIHLDPVVTMTENWIIGKNEPMRLE